VIVWRMTLATISGPVSYLSDLLPFWVRERERYEIGAVAGEVWEFSKEIRNGSLIRVLLGAGGMRYAGRSPRPKMTIR
jgi:hypothetical protein